MPVTEILLLRHGHRMGWSLDPTTGKYSSAHAFPTNLPADPPLAAHGVRQAHEVSAYLASEEQLLPVARQDRLRIYSSLFYRCLETLRPTVQSLNAHLSPSSGTDERAARVSVRGELGMSEWFGRAWFEQPRPASPSVLRTQFFPWLDDAYQSLVVPDRKGERIHEIHERVATALQTVIDDVDREYDDAGRGDDEVTLLVCGHAAQIICAGRALTGNLPEDDWDREDFKCFTCGISKFVRRSGWQQRQTQKEWKGGKGVAGGWDCVLNSWCGHLTQGEERGWHFHGDESFDSYGPGSGPKGIIVEEGTVPDDGGDAHAESGSETKTGAAADGADDGSGGISKL